MRYDFRCQKCGEVQEIELSMSYDKYNTLKCKKCGEKKLEKLISAPNIVGGSRGFSQGATCPTGTCPFV